LINIDSRSSKPIYEQIIDSIKENILKGVLCCGEKLPSVRELSVLLRITPNTVSRAYIELEKEGVIETIRGKGTYVSQDYIPKADSKKITKIRNELKNTLVEAYYNGIERDGIIEIIDELYKEIMRE
jgi:GntR family transcriptional regulator